MPGHWQLAHREYFAGTELPVCDRLQQQILSLPMINGLHDEEVDRVIEALPLAVAASC